MPTKDEATLFPFSLPSICKKKVTAAFDGGQLSLDGGVLLLAGADRRLGLIDRRAALMPDHRDPAQITHTMADILRARVLVSLVVTPKPTIRTICAAIPPSSWPADGCPAAAATSRPSPRCRHGRTRPAGAR